MSTEGIQSNWSAPAGSNLSSKQFYAVKEDSSGNLVVAVAGHNMDGILQDKPVQGQAGNYCRDGITKAAISASQTITRGDLLKVDTGGTLTEWSTGNAAVARARESLSSVAAVMVIEVEILRGVPQTF